MAKKSWKLMRWLAGALSVCVLAVTSVPTSVTAWAAPSDTELDNQTLSTMGSCDSTSYSFKGGGIVDFRGHRTANRGYNTDENITMKTTFNNNGYRTYIHTANVGSGGHQCARQQQRRSCHHV